MLYLVVFQFEVFVLRKIIKLVVPDECIQQIKKKKMQSIASVHQNFLMSKILSVQHTHVVREKSEDKVN